MSRQLSGPRRYFRRVLWSFLTAILISFPLISFAAEAPGALTIAVTDLITERPIPTVQLTITERETGSTRSVETDAQGRTVIEQLDPGLYSVSLAKEGFVSAYEPSVRVVTRKNTRIDFELRAAAAIQEVVVQGRQADAFASASSTYLDREALRSAVGGGADPLLSLDGLPGLASASEFAAFSVRGRGPRDNLLFVDDLLTKRSILMQRWVRKKTWEAAAVSRSLRPM